MESSSYPQGMHRTARTDDGDVETRDDACRHHEYVAAPEHGFAFLPAGTSHLDFAAIFAADDEALPTEGR